ncbi:RICIN domain-containing protein [Actinosynnema sp. NPDC050436]|uniref:RICIN domain-containing protein n=1 Tax=Actinosynnema sp. NPDC050436 TaxID=3155659 RepID=UPI0033F5C14D
MNKWRTAAATAAVLAVVAPPPAVAQDVPMPPLGLFLLRNVETGYCADLPFFGPGTLDGPVNQWHCRPGSQDNQVWQRVDSADSAGSFALRNIAGGLCMDVPYYDAVPTGTPISQYHCDADTDDNQSFTLRPSPTGWLFTHDKTGLCLGADGGLDARLTLEWCGSAPDQWEWISPNA